MTFSFPRLSMALAVPASYFAAAVFAIALSGRNGNIAALWPAGAILLAGLLRSPAATWPALLALAAGANLAANVSMGSSPAMALGLVVPNMLEPLLIGLAMRRFGGNGKPWFVSVRWMALFAASSILASAAAAVLGSAWLALLVAAPFAATWKTWFVADVLGLVIVTPFLLSWAEPFLRGSLTARGVVEAVLLTGLVAAVVYHEFSANLPFLFLVFPFLILLTFRTGLPGATAGAVTLAAITMWFTLQGAGPIAKMPRMDAIGRIQVMQLYLLVVLLSTVPIAIILAQRELLASQVRRQGLISETALTNMAQGLSMFDAEDRLVVCNQRFAELYGLPSELTRPGAALQQMLNFRKAGQAEPEFSEDSIRNIHAIVAQRQPATFTFELRDGRIFSVDFEPMAAGGYVATHDDITDRRRAEAEIERMARHDALTDLPNRVLLREHLDQSLAVSRRKGEAFALLCLDLDRFKTVNDSLGHPAGDKLLEEVARRLRACVGEADTIARLGGDEFAILQKCPDQPREATILARRIVEEISRPFDLDGSHVVVGTSIGVAVAPGDGVDPDLLFKNANLALYRAKAEGRGTYRFFEAAMDAQIQARRRIELDLRNALRNGEIQLHYQPLVALASDRVSGFEALMRWHHPERGFVSPAEFIPVAEEIGLIASLGEWAIRQACADAAGWPHDVHIAVNLSAAQFTVGNNLPQVVMSALAASGLAPGRLELEITESVLLDESETTLATLHRLRRLGVRISLDDFGTGYASLSYLRKFPFDKIKIDSSFVQELARRGECHAIVHAVVDLARALGMSTTAEGVETREQLDELRREGCTEVQGYLFSPPRPIAETRRLIEECGARGRQAA